MSAFGIMTYHYLLWTLPISTFSADTFLVRFSIYGVSIFYILSGLTLYYVYYNKMLPSKDDVFSFVKKRLFRILPLLWLVTIVKIIVSQQIPDLYNLFLNLTGLFGFIKWDTYFSTGIWSIGNELVFYAFFPFFILFTKSFKSSMTILVLVIFALYMYFAFVKLSPHMNLAEQWSNYVNPLNQVFLFLGGFLIGLFLHNVNVKNSINTLTFILGLGLFIFYPVEGDAINLVTGINRLIFTFSCFLICISFYKLTIKLPDVFHKPLSMLGEASYSVYLIHPMVYGLSGIFMSMLSKYIVPFPESVRLISAVISTLIISYYIYQYYEKYFMRLGRSKEN